MKNPSIAPEPATVSAASRDCAAGSVPSAASRRLAVERPRTRILYAEDDSSLRELGEELLVRSGYDVDTAGDGSAAWIALCSQEYHLLITDNQMPLLSGLELIRMVRRARMTVPIILASGTVGTLSNDELQCLECTASLTKPFTAEQLISSVREVLRDAVKMKTPAGVRPPEFEELQFHIKPNVRWGLND